jgi:hypothetical protein
MMRLLYSFTFAFFVGYLGMNLWDAYERYQAAQAGERLMHEHELKHQAILNDMKR